MRIRSIVAQEVSKAPDEALKTEAPGDEENAVARAQVRVISNSSSFTKHQTERKPLRPSSTLYEGDTSHLIEVDFRKRALHTKDQCRLNIAPCSQQCALSR